MESHGSHGFPWKSFDCREFHKFRGVHVASTSVAAGAPADVPWNNWIPYNFRINIPYNISRVYQMLASKVICFSEEEARMMLTRFSVALLRAGIVGLFK